MPIINYEERAKQDKNNLYANISVSETNKEYLRKFFDSYDVSPARVGIFCRHIIFFLRECRDVKTLFDDRETVNKIFKKIRENVKQGYYETIKAVSLKFVTWLNDDIKPKGFKDIKNSKKGQKRDLRPQDMITWEDGEKIISYTDSIQIKALIMAQLDGGFRPGELVDINFDDVTPKNNVIVIAINSSKTGQRRNVILMRAVPYLKKWLDIHPNKDSNGPLWIMEEPGQSRNPSPDHRYKYGAVCKLIRDLGEKAGINKPLDLYNLRHSACAMAKKENLPIELATKKFGHSAKYFIETYGRLTIDDDIERTDDHYRVMSEKTENDFVPRQCSICGFVNPVSAEYCEKCHNPVTLEKALEGMSEVESLKKRIKEMEKYQKILKKVFENPKLRKVLEEG